MPWIESHTTVERHRKVILMAADLDIPPVHLSGHLHALWHTVLEQQEDGDMSQWPDKIIAQAAMFNGDPEVFVALLRKHKFLDGTLIHDWLIYAGRYLNYRYRNNNPAKLEAIFKLHNTTLRRSKGRPKGRLKNVLARVGKVCTSSSSFLSLSEEGECEGEQSAGPQLPEEAVRLAQLLSDRIFANIPNRNPPTEAQLTKWAKEADLIHRKDGHDWNLIEDVMEWSQADPFWKSNILSMGKLREKWNTLLAQKNRPTNSKSEAVVNKTRALFAKELKQ